MEACARPIASARCLVPVDSHNERRALGALRSTIWCLENNAKLGEAFGSAIRIDLEKPLFDIETVGGACRPDFILTVIRPGCDPADDRHLLGNSARYVIEVMGFDDPEYESKSEALLQGGAREALTLDCGSPELLYTTGGQGYRIVEAVSSSAGGVSDYRRRIKSLRCAASARCKSPSVVHAGSGGECWRVKK
ncbi:MAG: hypothetical protein OXE57_05535 [Alphaproteobacteria bacterium]|nr:hypothetical protein [Alphaproteobacteria bacterium]